MWTSLGVHYSVNHITVHITLHSFRSFVRKQDWAPITAAALVGLALCSHLHCCGRNRCTDINGQSQVKGRQNQSCHPVGISSAGSGVCGHNFWGRGKPRALSAVLTVTHLLPFNLRVPGPQDGQRGPAVCWVAGSFLQRDLGQCLPQPHGWCHRVRHLQTAWLWGQWKSQLFCCS